MADRDFTALYTDEATGIIFHLDYGKNGSGGVLVSESANLDDEEYMGALRRVQSNYHALEPYCNLHALMFRYFPDKLDTASEKTIENMRQLLSRAEQCGYKLKSDYVQYFIAWNKGEQPAAPRDALKELLDNTPQYDGYVYLIRSPTGNYKIGRTANPKNRLQTFAVKLPFEVEYICLVGTENMYSLEQRLHAKFRAKRVAGEWFNLDDDDVEYIKSLAKDDAA